MPTLWLGDTAVTVIPPAGHLTAFVRHINSRMAHGNVVRHWKTVFTELIKEYNPQTFILPKIDDADKQRSDKLKRMIASIKKLAKKYWIKVIEIVLTTVCETMIPPLLPKTKAQLVPIITSNHPNLKRYELRVKKRGVGESEPYFLRLFMAVALGRTYQFQQVRS